MGTDITIMVEVRNPNTNEWVSSENWVDEYNDGVLSVPYSERLYTGRNYELFALLADVRNDDGLIIPFAAPRGCPTDSDKRIMAYVGDDEYGVGYFTLEELLSFDWSVSITTNALVDISDWKHWQERLVFNKSCRPRSWCKGASGKHISEDEARTILEANPDAGGFVHVVCKWKRPAYENCQTFWGSVIPYMLGLGKPQDVRMVFSFW